MSPELLKVSPRVANVHSNPSPSFQSLLSYWGGAHLRIASSGRLATDLATAASRSRWTARDVAPLLRGETTTDDSKSCQKCWKKLVPEVKNPNWPSATVSSVFGCLLERGRLREIPSKPLL